MLSASSPQQVGILVNDVAEINIDAALVSKKTGGVSAKEDTVELQNGCACCTAAEEFLQGIESLMKLARERERECIMTGGATALPQQCAHE